MLNRLLSCGIWSEQWYNPTMKKHTIPAILVMLSAASFIGCGKNAGDIGPSFHSQEKTILTGEFWQKVDGAYDSSGGAVVTFEKTTRSFHANIPSNNFTAAPGRQSDIDVLDSGVCTLKINASVSSVETVPELLTFSSQPHLIFSNVEVLLVYNVDDRSVSQPQRTLCTNEMVFWSDLKDLEITNYSPNVVKLGIKFANPLNDSVKTKLDELRTFKR